MNDLYAVAGPNGNLCPDCAREEFGEDLETLPEDTHTIVLESDDWKHEVGGLCRVCDKEIGT